MKIGIIKPGHDLSHISNMKEDTSSFGGMYEIRGLYDDLVELGHDVYLHKDYYQSRIKHDMIFIFGSDDVIPIGIKNFKGIKVQCITDMNLMFTAEQIGQHYILNQCEKSYNYFPFEKYIIRYKWDGKQIRFDDWVDRNNNMIYAGGSRSGSRDLFFNKYLVDNTYIDKIYTSSPLELPNKHDKIPMNELFKEYKDTKYGLVIADELYNSFGFVTQRPYEYMINGMICLFDENYNQDWDLTFIENKDDLLEEIEEMDDYYITNKLQEQYKLLKSIDFSYNLHILKNNIKKWTKE